jgi:nucleotide-binding universal stress UspA family protein
MLRVAVALDATDHDAALVAAAARLARERDIEVVLLHLVNPLTDAAGVLAERRDTAVAQVVGERERYLASRASEVGGATTTSVELLRHGEDRPGALARLCTERGVDAVMVATNRASGVRGLILGSVTQQLLRVSPCPVLVVRVP